MLSIPVWWFYGFAAVLFIVSTTAFTAPSSSAHRLQYRGVISPLSRTNAHVPDSDLKNSNDNRSNYEMNRRNAVFTTSSAFLYLLPFPSRADDAATSTSTSTAELTLSATPAAATEVTPAATPATTVNLEPLVTTPVPKPPPPPSIPPGPVLSSVSGEAKQIFNEGRALEMQGNSYAAERIYARLTKISPRFIYGWSNLGNTQVILGKLDSADEAYTNSINLCVSDRDTGGKLLGAKPCDDLYILYLNRGSLRLNNGQYAAALSDLELADQYRGKLDATILQNRARARELTSDYKGADKDYTLSIQMAGSNPKEIAPFWLRGALVKFQLGESIGALELVRRVEGRFPEAPEVRAALAVLLWKRGDEDGARRKFLEIPDLARRKFLEEEYLKVTIAWPPKCLGVLREIQMAVGDAA